MSRVESKLKISPREFKREVRNWTTNELEKKVGSLEKNLLEQHLGLVRLTIVPVGLAEEDIGAVIIPAGGGPKAVHEGVRVWKRLSKNQDKKPLVIPSGKVGVSKLVTERVGPGVNAKVMAAQLYEYGVPGDVVIPETESTHTGEMAENVGGILKKQEVTGAVAVTETVHSSRFFATFINQNPGVGLFVRPVSTDRDHMGSITDDLAGFPFDWSTRVSEMASLHRYSEEGLGPTDVHGVMEYLETYLEGEGRLEHCRRIYEEVAPEWDRTHEEVVANASRLRYR